MSENELFVWTSKANGHSWELLKHNFEAKPISLNGLRSSHDGKTLLVAFSVGGIIRLDDFDADSMKFKVVTVVNDLQDNQIMKVGFDIRNNFMRGVGNAFAFVNSPEDGADTVVFAASFNSLFVSTNGGSTWKEVYRLHNTYDGKLAHQYEHVGDANTTSASYNLRHDIRKHDHYDPVGKAAATSASLVLSNDIRKEPSADIRNHEHYDPVGKAGATNASHVLSNGIRKEQMLISLVLFSMTLVYALRRTHFLWFPRQRGSRREILRGRLNRPL